ncbi:hypothetical protein [Glaciihabitans sp. UYNi722]|uniref:hypothetical protein n=1 Tax=Glaciihabitans sp. UYNi722 TaxID=3156344 RepID=UPI00339968F4
MEWWNNFVDWLNSDGGWRVISGAVIPFIAIVVAGLVAAAIGRGFAKRVIALSDREVKASAVTALISAGRKAAVWNTLPAPEQQHIDHLIGDADIRLRLLPVPGTALAADWARHEIAEMKKNAVSFSFQAEQTLLVFRDRMIEWQARPTRAKKLFKNDLDSWAYDSSVSEQELVHQQQAWAAQQVTETGPVETVKTSRWARPAAAAVAAPAVIPAAVIPAAVIPAAVIPATASVTPDTKADTDRSASETTEVAPASASARPTASTAADDDIPELVEPAESETTDEVETSGKVQFSDARGNSDGLDADRSDHLVDDSIFSPASAIAAGKGTDPVDDQHRSRD